MKKYSVLLFYSKELGREVRIYLMLPANYHKSEKNYPVLYMHDGQNLFDANTGYKNQTWGILDTYEENPKLPEVIIVGIENGGDERSSELVPFSFNFADVGYSQYGDAIIKSKTDDYFDFIINQVKPYIDKNYRTYKSAKNTGIMGSSFGGVFTTYVACVDQSYFTRFAAVSSAYLYPGIHKELQNLVKESDFDLVNKFYLDVGTNEIDDSMKSKMYIDSNIEIKDLLEKKINNEKLLFKIVEGAKHSETDWEKRFPEIIRFLFNN